MAIGSLKNYEWRKGYLATFPDRGPLQDRRRRWREDVLVVLLPRYGAPTLLPMARTHPGLIEVTSNRTTYQEVDPRMTICVAARDPTPHSLQSRLLRVKSAGHAQYSQLVSLSRLVLGPPSGYSHPGLHRQF